MKFTETPLAGCFVISLERHDDARGFFARTFCTDELAAHGCETNIAQASMASNQAPGTLRGLHVQLPDQHLPSETKIVRCTRGAAFDVLLDLRMHSVTFGRWFSILLDTEQHTSVYVAAGVAHGYQVLEAQTDLHYMMSTPYTPGRDSGVLWNDPALDIPWPLPEQAVVSERDRQLPNFETWQSLHCG